MAVLKLYAELISVGDAIKVAEHLAKQSGMRLDAILEKVGVSGDDWSAIKELAADPRLGKLRDVLRAVDCMPALIAASGHAPWRDPHSARKSAKREVGMLDHHLS